MLTIQPKLENLKRQYKDKKEELARATMELYKQEHINPFSSCLPLLIQLPFMFALFQVLMLDVSKDAQQYLYTFIDMPPTFAQFSFIFGDLSKPSIVLAILAGLSQFWQGKKLEALRPARQANQKEDMTTALNKQMLYMMPVMTVIFGITLPGGLSLYWLVTTLLLIFQQEYFGNKESKAL
jgi:YidC/Oxa1 family membrane protein insertase